jgi:hypothetical protein
MFISTNTRILGAAGGGEYSEIVLNVESRSISLSGTSQLEKFYIVSAVLSCKI